MLPASRNQTSQQAQQTTQQTAQQHARQDPGGRRILEEDSRALANHLIGCCFAAFWLLLAVGLQGSFNDAWNWVALAFGIFDLAVAAVFLITVLAHEDTQCARLPRKIFITVYAVANLTGAGIITLKEFIVADVAFFAAWTGAIFGILAAGDVWGDATDALLLSREVAILP